MHVLCFLQSLQIEKFPIPLFTGKGISKTVLLAPNEPDSLSHTRTETQLFGSSLVHLEAERLQALFPSS